MIIIFMIMIFLMEQSTIYDVFCPTEPEKAFYNKTTPSDGKPGGNDYKELTFHIQLKSLMQGNNGIFYPGLVDDTGYPYLRGGDKLDIDILLA
jgi:hypothetical protein